MSPIAPQTISPLRQAQFILAIMILVGIILGVSFSKWFLFLDIAAGFSLLIGALNGTCLLTVFFTAMPWNKPIKNKSI